MKLKLTLKRRSGDPTDLLVDVDGSVTIRAFAAALNGSDPDPANRLAGSISLAAEDVSRAEVVLDPALTVAESGIGPGQRISVAPVRGHGSSTSAAVLTVLAGPSAGRSFDLPRGLSTIGRATGCDITLDDRMVSQHHAKVIVGETIEIVDDNSSNGIYLGADRVQRLALRPGDEILLGESIITISPRQAASVDHQSARAAIVAFNRSPRVDPHWVGPKFAAPEPPTPAQRQPFPIISAIVPLFMGVAILLMTGSAMSLVFVGLSPLMIIGGHMEQKRQAKIAFAEAVELFHANLADLVVDLRQAQDAERIGRNAEHPSTSEVVDAVRLLSPLVWTRRPEHEPFLAVRLGLGLQPSRTEVEMPTTRNAPPELFRELQSTVQPYLMVDQVPIAAQLRETGCLGVSGPTGLRSDVARGVIAQIVALHSPAEVVLCAMASTASAMQWDWIKWLPHVGGDHSPLEAAPLATTAPACAALVSEIAALIASRAEEQSPGADTGPELPTIVLLVEDDAPAERSAVVTLMEGGREFGVHVVWVAPTTAQIPAAARAFLEVDEVHGVATGKVIEAELVRPVVVEPLDLAGAEWLARRLSPVVDAGIQADVASDVPRSVMYLNEVGIEIASSPDAVIERWRESNSLTDPAAPRRRLKRDNSLRALVGRSSLDPVHLDLRSQGPHALVGGTTGAGKSEFLQTWVLGMATAHSPQRVTFLFVDYKGGSAFADCIGLPHSVGLVTDLSPHLVQRALISLNAELRHREHILNRKKAKDLLELERRGDPDCPPSLVIVVDEFAALVQEVPEFVDGVVNVAQRGRSLGLHLILATQRPAGVIKDNLRANTNLRVALRMADEDDSKDVIGSPLAGTFDPDVPGRGVVKTGPGRLTLFQAGYVGGWTTGEEPPPRLKVSTLTFGASEDWEMVVDDAPVEEADPGPTDIHRVVENLNAASGAAKLAAPRRPWLPELAPVYNLEKLPTPRRDSTLVYGVVDLPDMQEQEAVAFMPDVDGSIAAYGTGGTGKSALLRTLAVTAGFTARSGPCHVYGMDFGSRGLGMLEELPHVGSIIVGDDDERIRRLVSKLTAMVDDRAARYGAVNAASIEEYRRLASVPDEPRILVLIDGFSTFRNAYEVGQTSWVFEDVVSVAINGRPLGIHFAISADRTGAIPSTLSGAIQRKVALRLANEMDESMLNVPRDGFASDAPPGRGYVEGVELQVAVLGGSPDVAAQATAVNALAKTMRRAGALEAAPIERLAELIPADSIPTLVGGLPALGVADDDLGPIGFHPEGMFLVAGPMGSGRSTAVSTMVSSLRAWNPDAMFAYLGQARSPLAPLPWDRSASTISDCQQLAEALAAEWSETPSAADGWIVVLDGIGDFLNSDADFALQDLLKSCKATGTFVIAEGESSDLAGHWPILQAIKATRAGLLLQPDQSDGDMLLRTPFPRVQRIDFPVGRGMLVRGGRFRRVQVATKG